MVTQLSPEGRERIQSLNKTGKKFRTIAKMMDCSLQTVERWVNAAQIIDNKKRKRGCGPKPKLTGKIKSDVDKLLQDREELGSRRITPIINKRFKADISARSIRRFEKTQGFGFKKVQEKAKLTPVHKKSRETWAKKHLKDNWRKMIFSDSKIFRIGTAGNRVRTRGPAKIKHKDKYSGQFHVWWAFSYHRIYPPQIAKVTMNSAEYIKMLQKTLGTEYDKGNILIQDKATCNMSKKTAKWLTDHHIKYYTDWPTKGIDMNVIEHVWGTLEQEKREKDFKSVDTMKRWAMKRMKNFPLSKLRRYIDSMPLRMQAVVAAKGGYTKYF